MSIEKDKKILQDIFQFKELMKTFAGNVSDLDSLFKSDILSIEENWTSKSDNKFCLELTDDESNHYFLGEDSFYFADRKSIYDGPSFVMLDAPMRNRYMFNDGNHTLNVWFINKQHDLNLPDNYLTWTEEHYVLIRLVK